MARYEVLTSDDGNTWQLDNKFTDGSQAKHYTFSIIERGQTFVKMIEIEGSTENTILFGEPKPPESESDGGDWMRKANREGSQEAKQKLSQEEQISISNLVMLVGVAVVLVLSSIIIGKYLFHINDIAILFFISAGILSFAGIFYYVIAVIPAKISAMTFHHKQKAEEDTIEEDQILGAELRRDQLEIGTEEDLVPEEAFEIKKRVRQFIKNLQAVSKASNSRASMEMTSRMSVYAFLSKIIRSLAFEEKLDFEKQVLTMQEIYSLLGYPAQEISFFSKNILLFEALPLIRSMSTAGVIAFDMFNNDKKGDCIRHIKKSLDDWSTNALQNPFATEISVISFHAECSQDNLIRSICNSFIDFNVMKEVKWTLNYSVYVIKTGTPIVDILKDVISFSNKATNHDLVPRVSMFSGPIIDTTDTGLTVVDYVNQICNESHDGLLLVPKFKAVDFPQPLLEQMREVPVAMDDNHTDLDMTSVAISLQMLEQYFRTSDSPQSEDNDNSQKQKKSSNQAKPQTQPKPTHPQPTAS